MFMVCLEAHHPMRVSHIFIAIGMKRNEEIHFASFKATFANSQPLLEVLDIYGKVSRSPAMKQDVRDLTLASRHARLNY